MQRVKFAKDDEIRDRISEYNVIIKYVIELHNIHVEWVEVIA
jgi:hypothetical protein